MHASELPHPPVPAPAEKQDHIYRQKHGDEKKQQHLQTETQRRKTTTTATTGGETATAMSIFTVCKLELEAAIA